MANRVQMLNVRLTSEGFLAVAAAALEVGQDRSAWVREALVEKLRRQAAEIAARERAEKQTAAQDAKQELWRQRNPA